MSTQQMAQTPVHSPASLTAELLWLKDHPEFYQRPASIVEFLGPNYLNVIHRMRPAIVKILIDIFGTESNPDRIAKYEEAIITGGIGIGKTTIAAVVNAYMVHWVLCLKNPQEYFGLLDGSRIAFMQMSTSGNQAKEVIFGDLKARIDNSPWFQKYYHYDPSFKNQIRFSDKDIWIVPGDSAETTFEGYNILGGVLDEADSHKVTENKDYAQQGYDTISNRITSRFGNRGFLLVIGQKKKPNGFVHKIWTKMKRAVNAYTAHLTIWESLGWQRFTDPVTGRRQSFWYDIERYQFTTEELARYKGFPPTIIEVPEVYRSQFNNSPQKALRDLAGMPPTVELPFFHDPSKIEVARQHWSTWWNKSEGPLNEKNEFAEWFRALDGLRRTVHVDIAFSAEGDALGLAMGHVPEMVTVDDEEKPFIFIDLVMRMKARPGSEIILGDVRQVIYKLRDKLGFRIKKCTTDGFESTDFRQQMRKHGISTEVISCDKSKLPYQDFHDAVMEERIAIPPYFVQLEWSDPTLVDIVYREISQLQDDGKKIDHPPEGSKDVADAIAGVTHVLMGGKSFHNRGRASASNADVGDVFGGRTSPVMGLPDHPAINPRFSIPHMEPPQWKPPR